MKRSAPLRRSPMPPRATPKTWSAVRYGPNRLAMGWCAHKHTLYDRAATCARLLNVSWRGTESTWHVRENGHLL